MVWILFSWFVVGFITALFAILRDMRGEEFDEDYIDEGVIVMIFINTFLGYVAPIVYFLYYIISKKLLIKLLYKIANIGVKKGKE